MKSRSTARVISQKRNIADDAQSVWFAGVHSNVGGGYPDDALAYIPLVWMLNEARLRSEVKS
jgi:hypothetical protein